MQNATERDDAYELTLRFDELLEPLYRLPLAERLDVIRQWRSELYLLDREAAEQHYRQLAEQAGETPLTNTGGAS